MGCCTSTNAKKTKGCCDRSTEGKRSQEQAENNEDAVESNPIERGHIAVNTKSQIASI